MRTLLLLFLSLLLVLSSTSNIPERYGDVILNDKLFPQAQFSFPIDVVKLKDVQIYDIFARYFGAPREATKDEINVNIDLFDRPTGHVLFTIEGISVNRITPRSDYKIIQSSGLVEILPSSEPHNVYSVVGSVLTGTSPSTHGVVNREWPGKAGSEMYEVRNFFDAMVQDPDVTVVSASSTIEGTMVFAPSESSDTFNGFYWGKNGYKSISSSTSESPLLLAKKDFPQLLSKLSTLMKRRVVYSEEDSVVTIFSETNEPIVYDLTDVDDESLFAEVLFVLNMASHKVDFFSFHFQSLKNLYAKYGSSEEYDMAVCIVDAVMFQVAQTYGQDHACTILYFPENYFSSEVVTTVDALIKDALVPSSVGTLHYYPHLYLNYAGKMHRAAICQKLKSVLSQYNVDVVCSHSIGKRYVSQTPSPPPRGTPIPPGDDVTLMHIVLWTTIFMFVGMTMSCYHLANIDGSDEPEFKSRNFDVGRAQPQKVV